MKKIFFLILAVLMVGFTACWQSDEEIEKQKKHDDSLMEPERDAAIDNANKLLSDTTMASDTVKKDKKTTAKK
jgi:hypothetical protein